MSEPRQLPFDVEIEQALLGALITDNHWIDTVAADLEPRHFYDPLHQRLYEMALHLQTEGAVTPLILGSVMKTDPGLTACGGPTYLHSLALGASAMPNVKDYARLLRDLYVRRELIRIGENLTASAFDAPPGTSGQSLTDEATEALLCVGRAVAKPALSAFDIATESLQEVEDIALGKPVPIVKTGLRKLDDEIGGLRGGDLIVVAGKSGMGKSALQGCICLNTAMSGIPTIVFSIEMMRRQWVERMVCDLDFDTAERPLWYSRVRNGRLTDKEFTRFATARDRLHGIPFEIHDDGDVTMQQASARARAFKAKHGGKLGVVAIDYGQKVTPRDVRGQNREQAVAEIFAGAKLLAKALNWPVLIGSQMNEAAETRAKDERRPQASDVRESKGIMNEADLIISPWRPAFYIQNRKPQDCEPGSPSWLAWKGDLRNSINKFDLLGLKNRHGAPFEIELYCEIGANAIRDAPPATAGDRVGEDLLAGVN